MFSKHVAGTVGGLHLKQKCLSKDFLFSVFHYTSKSVAYRNKTQPLNPPNQTHSLSKQVTMHFKRIVTVLLPFNIVTVTNWRFSCPSFSYEQPLLNCRDMDMSPVHRVWPKLPCKAQWKGEEDKEDRKRGGETMSGNGQAWSLPSPRGQQRTEKMEETDCEIICGAPTTLAVKG